MEQNNTQEHLSRKDQKKKAKGNTMLIVIISCWLLFYLFMGSQSGIG
ncbi:MAG: hypothetical protein JKY62_08765 [Desulfocapsa sp.]|uniref:Uncharacterized protein n=1 Tax=Desulfotalea psychrophila TaxID=84980 RepID=A0ABS3ATU7_9BACT|nr:hypothetical protein [Desulfocapsa sp.]MBN4067935.1 hypothetical protein [Desulfotalea psychrophila]